MTDLALGAKWGGLRRHRVGGAALPHAACDMLGRAAHASPIEPMLSPAWAKNSRRVESSRALARWGDDRWSRRHFRVVNSCGVDEVTRAVVTQRVMNSSRFEQHVEFGGHDQASPTPATVAKCSRGLLL